MSRALWRRLLALPGEVEAIYTEGWDRAERTYARLERAEAERAALALERDGLAAELQKVGAELARWKEAHGEASRRAESLAARVAQLGAAADQAGERAAHAESQIVQLQGQIKPLRVRVEELEADRSHYRRGVAHWLGKSKGDGRPCGGCRGCTGKDWYPNICVGAKWIASRELLKKIEGEPPARPELAELRRVVAQVAGELREHGAGAGPRALALLGRYLPLATVDDAGGGPAERPDLTKPPAGSLVPAIGHDLTIHHVRPDDPTRTLCGMLCRGFEDGNGLRHGVDFSAGGAVAEVCGEPGERAAQIRKRVADGDRASVGDFACGGCADVQKGWSTKGAADGA